MATKISVIIPTYAPKDYLWECLGSLENQTLSKDEFEVILVLNGEREPYESLIRKKLPEYSFTCTLLYSTPNGVSRARNLGMDKAQGCYICFIDDDDWVSDNYLTELLSKACDDGIIEANVKAVDKETGEEYEQHFLSRAYRNYQPEKETSRYSNRSFSHLHVASCFLKNVLTDNVSTQISNVVKTPYLCMEYPGRSNT